MNQTFVYSFELINFHHYKIYNKWYIIDQIFALRQIIEKCNEHNRTLYIAFVDFKAAFDSIDRISLWDLIRISGTPPKLCRLLELLYSDSESCVRIGNDLSEWFSIASGVRQGCVVAPDLFNCVIDHLMLLDPHLASILTTGVSPTWTTPMTLRYSRPPLKTCHPYCAS